MKKKLFSIMLSLALMVTMMPAQTLVVSAATKTKATVSTQTGLKRELKNKKLKTLTVKTAKVKTFSVKRGKHKKVHLIIDARKSRVRNKSVFKKITIKGIRNNGKKHSFVEYAKNNTIVLQTKSADIGISKDAKVKEIKVTKKDTNLELTVNGEVKKVSTNRSSTIEINGSTEKTIAVKVTNTNADVKVINNTKATVNATDANGRTQEVKEGETKNIGGNTPSPTPIPTPEQNKTFKAVYNSSDASKTLTFYYDNVDHSGTNITVYENGTANYLFDDSKEYDAKWGYDGIRSNVKQVVIDESAKNYTGLTTTTCMLDEMKNAENITGVEYLDVSRVTDMSYMFYDYGYNSTNLTAVPNVSNWNTGNVTIMNDVFGSYGYKSTCLTAVPDVSNWNTENTTNMSGIFFCYGYSSANLNAVPDVSKWNTENVTNLYSTFRAYGVTSTELSAAPNVSEWDTSNVTNVKWMFWGYGESSSALNFTLDLSGWSVANVAEYNEMFRDAGSNGTWSVTIPAKTGVKENSSNAWYVGDGTSADAYIEPASGKQFTLAIATYTVTFEPEIDSGIKTGEVHDADGQEVTQITVPNGAAISISGSTITIGGDVYTAVEASGWTFNSFVLNPDSQTITADTTITVRFSQNQPG